MRTSGLMIMKFWDTVDLQKWIDCHENEWSQDCEFCRKDKIIIMRIIGLMIEKFWSTVDFQKWINHHENEWSHDWSTVDLQKWIDHHENEWSHDYEILKHCWASRCVSVDWKTVGFWWVSVVKFWSIVKLQRRDEFLSIEILSNFEKSVVKILKYFEVQSVFKNKAYTMIIVTSWMEDSVGF